VVAVSQTRSDVVVHSLAGRRDVRRAADALRLIAASAVLIPAVLLSAFADARVRRTELAMLESVVTLPATLRDLLTAIAQVVLVLVPFAILVGAVVRRRFALLVRFVVTTVIATAASVLLSQLLRTSHPEEWHGLLSGRGGVFGVTVPPAAWLSGATALLTVANPELSRRWRTALWWTIGTAAVLETIVGGFLPVDAVVAAALGISIGSLVLLTLGAPSDRPEAAEVADALKECGVDVAGLTEVEAPRDDPALFDATLRNGTPLTVQVVSGDDRNRSVLAGVSRWLLLRNPNDDGANRDVTSMAEHELLAMVAAGRAGARVPEPVVAYPVASRRGRRAALVAWTDVGARRMDLLASEQVSDTTLADLWSSVARLRVHRLAHRQLRTEHLLVDDDGHAWLTALAHAQLGATDALLDTDVAELLASLALKVGIERAVKSAVAGLGAGPVAAAAPYLQPLALLGATGAEVRAFDRARLVKLSGREAARKLRPGQRPDLLRDLRTAVADATATPAPALEHLSRLTWKRALTLLGAFVLLHLVIPQLANAPEAIDAMRNADWWWVVAALPAVFVAQAFATLLQLGTIPAELPFQPTYLVKFGGAFLNRVTPNNVGGMALSFRYLQKTGVDAGAATGSVGLQALAGMVANLILLSAFFAATGRSTHLHLSFHNRQRVFLFIALVLAACALFALTPKGREFFRDKIWNFLRSAGATTAQVAKMPNRVATATVGALGGPMVQIVALALCVHAVGGELPFVQLGAVYLSAKLISGAAPVPGGLGALEAGLIAGCSGLGMPIGAAASAVLIYRLLTFWLVVPIGWVCLKMAETRGYV